MKAPKGMNVDKGNVHTVVNPVYAIPEAPMHWFKTSIDCQESSLGMSQTAFDPCLMFARTCEGHQCVIWIKLHDRNCAGTQNIIELEEQSSPEFLTKPKETVACQIVRFKGVNLSSMNDSFVMNYVDYTNNQKNDWTARESDV